MSEVVDSVFPPARKQQIFDRGRPNQKLTNLFYAVKITSMQSNKASKKTNKTAPESTAPVTAAASAETISTSRPARSPKSKSESTETSAVKRHRKAASTTTEEAKPSVAAPVAPVAAVVEIPAPVVARAESNVVEPVQVETPNNADTLIEDTTFEPSYEQIAMLAHALWKERGGEHGFAEQDWFRAEQVLKTAKAGA